MKASKSIIKLIAFRMCVIVFITTTIAIMCGYKSTTKEQPQRPKFGTIENAVRDALGKPSGELTADDYKKIKQLSAPMEDIKSLEGIQYCVNLRKLDLSRNQIRDIFPLEGLTKLEELDLHGNSIMDIIVLENLGNLRYLNLDRNRIVDINPLQMLHLDTLVLANNNITDIYALSNMKNLYYLDLGGNRISDLSPLGNVDLGKLRYVNLIPTDMTSQVTLDTIEFLEKRGVYVEKRWEERACARELERIGSAQYTYAHKNPNNPNRDYCSWQTLHSYNQWRRQDPLSDWIQDYSIPVFRVIPSAQRPDNRRTASSFTIVAVPKARKHDLRTYSISTNQIIRVWVGDDSQWTTYPIQLNDPKLWCPLR